MCIALQLDISLGISDKLREMMRVRVRQLKLTYYVSCHVVLFAML